jgi:hypothetical protein
MRTFIGYWSLMAAQRIGIALGGEEIVALLPDLTRTLSVPVELAGVDDPGPTLRQALGRLEEALRAELGGSETATQRLRLRVALLPPLCEVRLIELPPLRPEEVDQVLRREAGRHFLGRGRSLVVGGRGFASSKEGRTPVLGAAAPRALVEALQRGVESRGWELERIVPAHAAWLQALDEAAPIQGAGGNAPRLVVAVEGDTVHLMRYSKDAPDQLRRLPVSDLGGLQEAAGPGPGRAVVLGAQDIRATLARALTESGWQHVEPKGSASARAQAARHAGDSLPELVPAPLASARREQSRQLTSRLAAAAVVTLTAAAAVHLWGTAKEVRTVEEERAELRTAVRPAIEARDSLDRMTERLAGLEGLARESSRWTFSLVELAVLLPPETYLISLRAAGDTVVVEAEGGRAGDALEALRGAPSFRDVRQEGAIQRELEEGTTSRERFTISALLTPPEAPKGSSHPREVRP